MKSTITKKDC